MNLNSQKFQKIRAKKVKDQPALLVDQYYIYDNPALVADTYTAKKLHNLALYDYRQALFKHHWLSMTEAYHLIMKRIKANENLLYRQMHLAKAGQNVVRQVGNDFANWHKAVNAYHKHPAFFTGRPRMPKYLRNPRTSFQLDVQSFSQRDGYLSSKTYGFKVKIYQHHDMKGAIFAPKYHNIWVVPVHRGVKLCCSYEAPSMPVMLPDNGIYIGIDPGVDNMFACASNKTVSPILINGRPLKAVNQESNKLIAQKRKLLAQYQQNQYQVKTRTGWQVKFADSHRIQTLFAKRNRQIANESHNAIMRIIAYAQNCDAHTIIIGKNRFWKQGANMGKQNNQNFIGIPHALMINKLAYRAAMYGIAVITTNESYTSQTSFLDGEQPVKQNGNHMRQKLGKSPINRRIKRGLFKSNHGIIINADVNSALQIIKKVVPQVSFDQGIADVVLHPVKLNPTFGY